MEKSDKWISNQSGIVLILYFLLGYPLFYFSYKFCLPDFGGHDFYSYYGLYKDWDFENTPSPFNMRLISSYMIYLMNKVGFHYDTEIVLAKVYSGPDPQVFFNAVLFNFLCVWMTCLVIYKTILHFFSNRLYAFLGGVIYLLGFGTLFFSLKPLSEACGILLMALAYYCYLRKSAWLYFFLLLSVFQREYLFFVMVIIAAVDFYRLRNKYHLLAGLTALFGFAIYYVLRKTFFFTPHFDYQTTVTTFSYSILHPDIDPLPFFMQSFMVSNILIIYLLTLIYKKWKDLEINKPDAVIVLLLFAQVIVMSVMAQFGNNAGRYFYYASPVLIFLLFKELWPLMNSFLQRNEHNAAR